MFEISYYTDKGAVLESSDDRLLINGKVISSGSSSMVCDDACLIAVFDGVGGEDYGDEAAECAASALGSFKTTCKSRDDIEALVNAANDAVLKGQKLPGHGRMATTVVGLLLDGNTLFAFNVGDSRAYRFKRSYITQLSVDHTVAMERKKLGVPFTERHKHTLTRFLGDRRADPHIYEEIMDARDDSIFLLCSDGITDVLDDQELKKILSSNLVTEAKCIAIVNAALKKGADDNISIVLAKRLP